VALLFPAGILMGIPLPAGVRLLARRQADLLAWAWAMNAALSVLGATLAVFIAMNWGFSVTLVVGGLAYTGAAWRSRPAGLLSAGLQAPRLTV
jgi:hypothetical protein